MASHDRLLDYLNRRIKKKEEQGHKWNVYMALNMIKRKWIELKPKEKGRMFKRWINSEIKRREQRQATHQYYIVLKQVRQKYDEIFPAARLNYQEAEPQAEAPTTTISE